MTLPEPPDDAYVVLETSGVAGIFYRRDKYAGKSNPERRWVDHNNLAYGHQLTWGELCGSGTVRLVGPALTAPIAPADMQDGKRYRIVFEGRADVSTRHKDARLIAQIDWENNGNPVDSIALDWSDIEHATHIKEIS